MEETVKNEINKNLTILEDDAQTNLMSQFELLRRIQIVRDLMSIYDIQLDSDKKIE